MRIKTYRASEWHGFDRKFPVRIHSRDVLHLAATYFCVTWRQLRRTKRKSMSSDRRKIETRTLRRHAQAVCFWPANEKWMIEHHFEGVVKISHFVRFFFRFIFRHSKWCMGVWGKQRGDNKIETLSKMSQTEATHQTPCLSMFSVDTPYTWYICMCVYLGMCVGINHFQGFGWIVSNIKCREET